MAKADQIKALVRSHSERDDQRFYSIALQMAAHAARTGQIRFARELKELIDELRANDDSRRDLLLTQPRPIAQPRGELAGILSATYPKTQLKELIVEDNLRQSLERVLKEQRNRSRIQEYGFTPMRRLLLEGPPGTGKTLTASAMAGELNIPLFTIQLDGLITKYLGGTASKLRLVFDAMQSSRGVYFFDEFDALGGHRDALNEMGEIRRILNSFLQFLETDGSESLVIGATNHIHLLDHALFRRFGKVLRYSLPSAVLSEMIMKRRLTLLETTTVDWDGARNAAIGLSHAEIILASEQAAKEAILDGHSTIIATQLIVALRERHRLHSKDDE